VVTRSLLTRSRVWIVGAVLLLGMLGAGDHGMWTPDEPRVAAVAKEMAETGDVIVPTLGGVPFVEQPPLGYALFAAGWRTLGPWLGEDSAFRMTAILLGLATVLLTARLAHLLVGPNAAVLAAAILATEAGFIVTTHTVRCDSPLVFFVTASIGCAAEAYLRDRPWFLLPAALAAAGGFLSKGPIAVVFIGLAAVPLFLAGLRGPKAGGAIRWWGMHVAAAALATLPVAAWMAALYQRGGDAWNAWFWDNQVGRFSGAATALGHHNPHAYLYYVWNGSIALLPWSIALVPWVWNVWRDIRSRRFGWRDASLALWGWGALVFLTASVTKRDIYLEPALPAFAIMVAAVLERPVAAWLSGWFRFWCGLCIALLAVAVASPWLVHAFARRTPEPVFAWLSHWHAPHLLALAFLAAGIAALVRWRDWHSQPTLVTALLSALAMAGLMSVGFPAIDRVKNMREPARTFAASVPDAGKARTGCWIISETDRAALSLHAN